MATKIQTQTGNLLNVVRGHMVHGCNAQGVMGSGVALAIKNKYPVVFDEYRTIYENKGLELGLAYPVLVSANLLIWNAITQDMFGQGIRQVSYDAIATCFESINESVNKLKEVFEPEIHIPKIGATRGGGNWEIIREIIEQTVDFPTTLWLPDATVDTI